MTRHEKSDRRVALVIAQALDAVEESLNVRDGHTLQCLFSDPASPRSLELLRLVGKELARMRPFSSLLDGREEQ